MAKTADRPHNVTIALALFAAVVSATGVYISYKNYIFSIEKQDKEASKGQFLPPVSPGTSAEPTTTQKSSLETASVENVRQDHTQTNPPIDHTETKPQQDEGKQSNAIPKKAPVTADVIFVIQELFLRENDCLLINGQITQAGFSTQIGKSPFGSFGCRILVGPISRTEKESVREKLKAICGRGVITQEEELEIYRAKKNRWPSRFRGAQPAENGVTKQDPK